MRIKRSLLKRVALVLFAACLVGAWAIRSAFADGGVKIWTAPMQTDVSVYWDTNGNGLNGFDSYSGKFILYQHDELNPTSISSDSITSIFADSSGIIWIGTQSKGIRDSARLTDCPVMLRREGWSIK